MLVNVSVTHCSPSRPGKGDWVLCLRRWGRVEYIRSLLIMHIQCSLYYKFDPRVHFYAMSEYNWIILNHSVDYLGDLFMVLYLKNFAFSLSASVFLQAKVVLCAMIMTVSRLKERKPSLLAQLWSPSFRNMGCSAREPPCKCKQDLVSSHYKMILCCFSYCKVLRYYRTERHINNLPKSVSFSI